ncbi:hypothetical protein [Mesobacterium pallidum]|uniref:hypothetical protein n=1 Tax=Mesobacterium pallidum TaxID=2872037 RepID=UPI001EE347D2|nr:hypothetical protein [Mesobacterium pallidum]
MMLSPGFQGYLAANAGMGPASTAVDLPPEVAAKFPSAEQMAEAGSVPWSVFNEKRSELAERWQREIMS